MARKGCRYRQVPTLWHIGIGNPCRVMRKRRNRGRWVNRDYSVLTRSRAIHFTRLKREGKIQIRRDVGLEMFISAGIVKLAKLGPAILEGKRKMMARGDKKESEKGQGVNG